MSLLSITVPHWAVGFFERGFDSSWDYSRDEGPKWSEEGTAGTDASGLWPRNWCKLHLERCSRYELDPRAISRYPEDLYYVEI